MSVCLTPYQYPKDSPDFKGYYKRLGIKPDASAAEIKSAFRTLYKSVYPPNNLDEDDLLRSSIEAYKALSNPVDRARYHVSVKPVHSVEFLLRQAREEEIVLPTEKVTVGGPRYTYYTGKGEEEVDSDVVNEWYEYLVQVFRLYGIKSRPRVAIHNLGRAFDWSKIDNQTQIAHFDRTTKPSWLLAHSAVFTRNQNTQTKD